MPSSPNTPLVETSIQTMCQGLIVAGASSVFFPAANVVIGKFKTIENNLPACEITLTDDESGRLTLGNGIAQGGKVHDSELYLIEVTLDMTDSIAVENQLALIRDALTKAFHASATLATSGVQYAGWQQQQGGIQKGTAGYSNRNGVWYRNFRRKLYVNYEYSVTITL